jgi:O-antigen/teichoic acid export membrane protein
MALPRRSAAELVAGSGIASMLSIAFVALAGRVLGAREYADLAAGLAVLYLVGGALSPIVPTISHFAALHLERGEAAAVASLRRAFWLRVSVVELCLLPFAAAGAWLATRALGIRSPWTMPLALAAVFLYVLLTIDRAVMQGSMQFRRFSVNAIAESALRTIGVALLLPGALAPAAMAIYTASLALALLLSRVQFGPFPAEKHRPVAWGPLLAVAAPNFLLMLNLALQQNADVLVARRLFEAAHAGQYGAAVALVRGIGLIAIPFAAAVVPALTVLRERGQPFTRTLLGLCGAFATLGAVAVAAFVFFGDQILLLLYGSEFIEAAPLLGRLSLAALVGWLGYLLGQSLVALHRFRFLWFYSAMTVVQLAGYALFHETLQQLIHVQIVCQVVTVAVLAGTAVTMRACSESSSTTSTPKPQS